MRMGPGPKVHVGGTCRLLIALTAGNPKSVPRVTKFLGLSTGEPIGGKMRQTAFNLRTRRSIHQISTENLIAKRTRGPFIRKNAEMGKWDTLCGPGGICAQPSQDQLSHFRRKILLLRHER